MKLALIKRITCLAALIAACTVSMAHAESKLIPGSNITGRERAYAIYQFHAEALPMARFRSRLGIPETLQKANAGDIRYYMSMFFYQLYAESYVKDDPTKALDVCSAANWVDKATKGQVADGAYWMSYIYLNGYGVPKNPELSYRWFLFWAATMGIELQDLPRPPSHFGLDAARAQTLQGEVRKWDALNQPDLNLAPCPGCEAAGDHMCKIAELRKLGLEPSASE